LGWHSGPASHLGTLIQGYKGLDLWSSRKLGNPPYFTEMPAESLLGKAGLEDLQSRLSRYKGDAPKILELILHSTKGQLSSFPFPLSHSPPASIGNSIQEPLYSGDGVFPLSFPLSLSTSLLNSLGSILKSWEMLWSY
jgi:hypothetical protein